MSPGELERQAKRKRGRERERERERERGSVRQSELIKGRSEVDRRWPPGARHLLLLLLLLLLLISRITRHHSHT